VHRSLRQPELAGQLRHAEPALATREQPEDRRGALDRLDPRWHRPEFIRTRFDNAKHRLTLPDARG
jgi:hypothetical protein